MTEGAQEGRGMETGRFRDSDLQAARAEADRRHEVERHTAHVFPHPIWDGGDRIQLHVWEDPATSPEYFVEIVAPLDGPFRAGLGRLLAAIAREADAGDRLRSEQALLVEFTGFWQLRDRIEEGFMRRMLVVTSWRYEDAAGNVRIEGFPPAA
jgi:hypothetical protein